jgi:hypothetical protein
LKSNYTKPLLAVELFSLTQSVAHDCNTSILPGQLNFNDPSCVWDLGGGTSIFIISGNCVLDGESMGYGCYNNPSEGNYIFRS